MPAHVAALETGGERLIVSDVPPPLKSKSGLLRWVALPVGQRLGITICRDRGEVLIEVLTRAIKPNREVARALRRPIASEINRRDSRVVDLNRCSVSTAFTKRTQTQKRMT